MTEPGPPFSITELGPSRLALVGELDLAGAPELEAKLAGCDGDVVLDCSGLTFVGAVALDLFVRARTSCETRGVKFALVAPPPCLSRLLAITGLDDLVMPEASGSGA